MSMYSLVSALKNQRGPIETKVRRKRAPSEQYLTEFHRRIVLELKSKLDSYDYKLSKRKCPSCGKLNILLLLDGVPLDVCKECRGFWFDSSELVHFTSLMADIPGEKLTSRSSRFTCPVCGERMREYQFRRDANVMVDSCPKGHGIYLEDDEFRRVLVVSDQIECLAGHLNDEHLRIWRQTQSLIASHEYVKSNVICPDCDSTDVTLRMDGIDVDYCLQCRGFWFDAGELSHFTKQSEDIRGRFLQLRASSFACPICGEPMWLYQFSKTTNLMIEGCARGHGVFLRGDQFLRALQDSEPENR